MDTTLSMEDSLVGCLLGTAMGDALGLASEGMAPASIARRFGALDRFHILGRTGFVSDDTEQSALMAQAVLTGSGVPEACARAFGWSMVGWFLRMPWGIGLGTLRACLKLSVGWRPSGVNSAGNGAAMRACVVGVLLRDDAPKRRALGRALAEVTHTDPRAVEGALFVAEVGALLSLKPTAVTEACALAREVVHDRRLDEALAQAMELAASGATLDQAASHLGTTGYVVHSVALATYCLLSEGGQPMNAIRSAIRRGGDTDTNAAIVGAWVGAAQGVRGLDESLLGQIHDGPFGPSHLRSLAGALAASSRGERPAPVTFSTLGSLTRNLALFPVVVAHVLRRLIPF